MAGKNKSENGAKRPIHTVRYGGVKAAIWRNIVENGDNSRPMYNVTVSRSYRDGDSWKDSASFGYDDLLLLSKVADECHSYIHQQLARDSPEQRENRPAN